MRVKHLHGAFAAVTSLTALIIITGEMCQSLINSIFLSRCRLAPAFSLATDNCDGVASLPAACCMMAVSMTAPAH